MRIMPRNGLTRTRNDGGIFSSMLRFLSQRKKSQKMVWIILSSIMVFGMVAFYSTPSRRFGVRTATGASASAVNEDALVAKVGRQDITAGDYMKGLNTMIQAYQGILSRQGGKRSDMDYNQLKGMGLDKS